MKTPPMQEMPHELARVLERVRRGETITVTTHGRPVAKRAPADPEDQSSTNVRPDFERRLRSRFSQGPLPGKPVSELLHEQRDERV